MSYVNFRDVAGGAAISDSRLLPRVRNNNGDSVEEPSKPAAVENSESSR